MSPLRLALIIVPNLLPLIGVLLWDWDIKHILLVYWFENLVIGFWTLTKMLTVSSSDVHPAILLGPKLFMGAFFTVHYGMFCMGHGSFLLSIMDVSNGMAFFPFKAMWNAELVTDSLMLAVGAMFLGHGIAYVQDFWMKKGREKSALNEIMFSPYGHIVVIHIGILLGAFLTMATNSGMPTLILIVLGKLALEIITARRRWKKEAQLDPQNAKFKT